MLLHVANGHLLPARDIGELPPATAVLLARLWWAPETEGVILTGLRMVQQRHPGDFWINLTLSDKSWNSHPPRFDEALRYGAAAASIRPQDPVTHSVLGRILQDQGLLNEAMAEFQEVIRLNDEKAGYLEFGGVQIDMGRWDDAITALRKGIELNTASRTPNFTFGGAYYFLGFALSMQAQWDDAIVAYRKATEDYRQILGRANNELESIDRALEGPAHSCLVTILFQEKKTVEGVIRECKEALRVNPRDARAHVRLGAALYEKNNKEEAIRELQLGRDIDIAVVFPLIPNLAAALDQRRPWKEFISENDFALARAHIHLSKALQARGDLAEAKAVFADAAPLIENDPQGQNNLAWLMATTPAAWLRDPKNAVAYAKKAVALNPTEGDYWNTLGVAHYRNGDWKEAIASLERTSNLRYERTSIDFFFLAMANCQLGDKDKARAWYAKGVAWMQEKSPESAPLREFRAEAGKLLGNEAPPAKRKN